MEQNIKIIPAFLKTVYTPAIRRDEANILAVDYGGDIEIVEAVEELNDAAKLKESTSFDADLPYSNINRWIVNTYGESVSVIMVAHGLQLPDREILVNAYNEQAGQYDVSFVRSEDWIEIFKNLAISDIDGFAPFQLSEAFIDSNQINDSAYPGPGLTPTRGFYTPLVYYGGLQRFNEANSLFELTYADYRLWFHYGKLLEQCFFAAGWKMDCPFLLTAYGQRIIGYLVGESKIYDGHFSNVYKNKLQLSATRHYAFMASSTANQVVNGVGESAWWNTQRILFGDDSTPPNFDNGAGVASGFYKAADSAMNGFLGKWKYKITLRIQGAATISAVSVRFAPKATFSPFLIIYSIFFDEGGKAIAINELFFDVPANVITTIEINATVESVLSFVDIAFGTVIVGANVTILPGSTIEGNCEYVIMSNNLNIPFSQNDNINKTILFPQSWLSPEIKAMDVLESYCHRTNSKLYTDRARRIVGIYTEHDVPTYGELTEPYYFDTIEQDMSLLQVENSAQVNLKDVVAPAKYILGFKESTDAYVESVTGETPFDAVIDMTPYAENIDPAKEHENRDNLTEPTLERPFVEIRNTNPNSTPVSVMAVLDNMVGEASVNPAPRTAYAYGIVKHKVGVTFKEFKKRWGGITFNSSLVAYATQYPSGEIVTAGGVLIPNDKTLVYDHTEAVTEPMKRYWLDTISVLYTRQTRKLTIVVGSFNRFVQMNFRHLYRFKFMGIDWKGRLTLKRTKINDFRRVEVEVVEDKIC